MPSKSKTISLRGLLDGLNLRADPLTLKQNEAQVAQDVKLVSGVVTSLESRGIGVATNLAGLNANWIWLVGGGQWLWSNEYRFTMDDGQFTYTTQVNKPPLIYDGTGVAFNLGIIPPLIAFWAIASGGTLNGTFNYGISYQFADGHESNIQDFNIQLVLANQKVTFNATSVGGTTVWPSDTRVTKVQLWRAAVTAGVVGTYFRVGGTGTATVRSVTTLVDDGSQTLGALGLAWTWGGDPTQTLYTGDHAPAPPLNVLADRVHAMASGITAVSSMGIVGGFMGNSWRWCVNGQPLYWPGYAEEILDARGEAAIVYPGFIALFTSQGFYAFSGYDDSAMSVRRLDAGHFIASGWGRSAKKTPYGTIYVSQDGLAVFDGTNTQLVLSEKLPNDYFVGYQLYTAGYYGDYYVISTSRGVLLIDLRDGWQGARLLSSASVMHAFTTVPFQVPFVATAGPSLPVADPGGLAYFGMCSDNQAFPTAASKLYVAGGYSLLASGTLSNSNASYILDTSTPGAWATSTHTMTAAVSGVQAVYLANGGTARVYVYSGVTDANLGSANLHNGMQIWTVDTGWADDVAAIPYKCVSYAACSDLTAGDTTHLWVHGGGAGSSFGATLSSYTASGGTGTWLSSAAGAPILRRHQMIYCPGSLFSDAKNRLFLIGGITVIGGVSTWNNTVYCCAAAAGTDFTAGTWTSDATSDSGGPSATAAGFTARADFVSGFDQTYNVIILQGGVASDGTVLQDMWSFDPVAWVNAGTGSRVTAWQNSVPTVNGIGSRAEHGGSILGDAFYIAGGISTATDINKDTEWVIVTPLPAGSGNTPGLYSLAHGDGGNIRQYLTSGTSGNWTWQTGDVEGEHLGAYLHPYRFRADYIGDLNLAVVVNGVSTNMVTLSSAVRTKIEQYLPFWTGVFGQRLSLSVSGQGAGPSLQTTKLWWAEVDVSEESAPA